MRIRRNLWLVASLLVLAALVAACFRYFSLGNCTHDVFSSNLEYNAAGVDNRGCLYLMITARLCWRQTTKNKRQGSREPEL